MSSVVAVDIGGTFTDLVAYDHETQEFAYTKAPTTYENFVDGIFDCYAKTQVTPAQTLFLNHGTTLVINAYIQRRGASTALITTRGFRDLLEIGRANRPDPFDLHYHRAAPLIPRQLRFEVDERVDSKGRVLTPLDMEGLDALGRRLVAEGVRAVAIFFMNSYANPDHEVAAAARLRATFPELFVTYSTELTREWYEYERTSTVAANAFVGPQVNDYIRGLQSQMTERGFAGALSMMGSNGGLLSVARACRQPVALVESGPVGGCIGAGAYAERLGVKNLVAFDMGGTTAKCALISNGQFSVETTYYADGYVHGFPIRSPVVNIVEVGSGGGSIAWLDAQKRMHVGPQSAGSSPGPVCYGLGGAEPTVTDANLVLGRLDPAKFLGGELRLDTAAAERAIADRIAEPLGFPGRDGLIRMAEGVLSIATVVMAGAIRKVSVENGLDPRDFVLFAYGGGGPLHASALAHELNIPTVIVPPAPGNFSAVGMLLADARIDAAETFVGRLDQSFLEPMSKAFAALEAETAAALRNEFGATEVFFERSADMRFIGQNHSIKVPLSTHAELPAIRAAFEADYRRRYGHADAKADAEVQTLHVSAFARRRRPDLARLPKPSSTPVSTTRRPIYFGAAGGWVETNIYDRAALPPGFAAEGPAVIEEYGSTTLVAPDDRFVIGELYEIRITCEGGANG